MQCLVIGYGSIGKRHASILKNLGCQVSLVSSQKITNFNCYENIETALEKNDIKYVVIANATHLHYTTLIKLIDCHYQNIVLVEKPLFSRIEILPENKFSKVLVGYNLRFHELMLNIKKMIQHENLITFSAYVGQYLPTWRKGTDYRNCYSAKKADGGGVLRDLSHELDYSIWLCGESFNVAAIGGHFSDLEIDSDDVYSIMMQCQFCPIVNLQLNYLDRHIRREITINTQRNTIHLDLIQGILQVNGKVKKQCPDAIIQSYIQQHQAVLKQDFSLCCDYSDGCSVIKLIESIENSANSRTWISV